MTVLVLAAFASARFGGEAVGGPVGFVLRWGVALGLLFTAVWLLLRFAPAHPGPHRWISFGSALCVIAWVGTSLVFGLYVTPGGRLQLDLRLAGYGLRSVQLPLRVVGLVPDRGGGRRDRARRMADVKLSHPDKVLFPADGITKADLAGYYEAVAPAMVPHTRDRAMNLWRWNAGIERPVVVQQAIPKGAPEWVATVEVPRRRGGSVTHAMANDADTLRWLAQVNCVTPHVWTSRADRLDRPDRMIFDLDPPDEGADFDHIREGALAMGELLRELGREPYAMTSGSRGIHVVAPLRRTQVHDVVREQTREIAEELAARHPTG